MSHMGVVVVASREDGKRQRGQQSQLLSTWHHLLRRRVAAREHGSHLIQVPIAINAAGTPCIRL